MDLGAVEWVLDEAAVTSKTLFTPIPTIADVTEYVDVVADEA